MNEYAFFSAGLGCCLLVVLIVIGILHSRFSAFMVDLCEGESRGGFWTVTVEAWFFLFAMAAALSWKSQGYSARELFLATISQIKSGLSGASTAIILFSAGLLLFVGVRKVRGRENMAREDGE